MTGPPGPIAPVAGGTRFPALDGLRGIAILLVMLHHFVLYTGAGATTPADTVLARVAAAAWCGVDLFFVLSGFLITGILLDTRADPRYFRTFFTRRALRIFPLYYGVLILTFVGLPLAAAPIAAHTVAPGEAAWYWTYLVNLRVALDGWPEPAGLAHFWSLAVEEQFYLAWPAVVLLCAGGRLTRVCLGVMLGALALRAGLYLTGEGLAAYVLMPTRMDALATGALVAVLLRTPGGIVLLRRWSGRMVAGCGASLAALGLWQAGLDTGSAVTGTIGFTALALLAGGVIGMSLDLGPRGRLQTFLVHPALRFFGIYSYGLYVFHHPIAIAMQRGGWTGDRIGTVLGSGLPGTLTALAGGIAASIALALVSWHLLEAPCLRLKERVRYAAPPYGGHSQAAEARVELAA